MSASAAGIIVAAGRGRRMGFDKLLAPLCGKPVLQWSLDAFLEAQCLPAWFSSQSSWNLDEVLRGRLPGRGPV